MLSIGQTRSFLVKYDRKRSISVLEIPSHLCFWDGRRFAFLLVCRLFAQIVCYHQPPYFSCCSLTWKRILNMANEPTKLWYNRRRFRVWFSALSATVIHGVAGAGGSFVGLATAKGIGVDVPQLNLKQFGVVLLASGLSSLFAFLRKSPLPRPEDDTKPFHPPKGEP